MRERLDCALFSTLCNQSWTKQYVGTHVGGRLHIAQPVAHIDAADPVSAPVLSQWAMPLRRFDVCLLALSEQNLAWARTTLLHARGAMHTPIFGLVLGLRARALNDLYALGMADFVREPLCLEELRMRIERWLDTRRYPVPDPHDPSASAVMPLAETGSEYEPEPFGRSEAAMCSNILERTGRELDAFAAASASRCANSHESFKAAKSQVIERFETAYIRAALGRHAGNIAMAARAAQKHRRAFWALMRKYDIDAAPYRVSAAHHMDSRSLNPGQAGKI